MTFSFYLTRLLEEQQTKYIPQNSQSPLNTRTNGEYSAFPLNTETLPLPFAAEYNYFLYLEHCCFEKRSFGVERQSSSVEHRVIPPRTMFPTQFYNNTTFSLSFLHFCFSFLRPNHQRTWCAFDFSFVRFFLLIREKC